MCLKPNNVTDSGIGVLGTTTGDSNYIRQFSQGINIRIAGSGSTYGTGNVLVAGEWIYLAITRDSSNVLKWFVNGAYIGSSATQSGTFTFNNFARSVSTYFDGSISNVSLYQTALDAQTISQMAKIRFTPMRDNRFSAVSFDGADTVINCGSDSSLDNIWNGGGTFTAWIFPKSDGEGDDGRIAEKRDTGNGWTFVTREESSGSCKLRLFINYSTTNGIYTTNADVTIGAWNYVAITYDTSGAGSSYRPTFYVNGVESSLSVTTDTAGTADSDASEDFTIGGNKTPSRIFDGSISSVAIYNVTKTEQEIYAQYSKGITHNPSADTGLVGLWLMGDDTSKAYPTIADSSSNSNDGTMTSMASDDIVQQMVAGYDMGAFESSSEELSAERITNGDFSAWTADNPDGWSVSTDLPGGLESDDVKVTEDANGARIFTTGTNINLRQNPVMIVGTMYKVTIIVHSATSGDIKTTGLSSNITNINASGTYTVTTTASSTTLNIKRNTACDIVVSSVSVKQVLQSDLSDTYPAIIDVNEPVLGVELFSTWTNGNTGFGAYPAYDIFSFSDGVLNIAGTGSTVNMTVWEDISLVANTVYKITYSVSGAIGGGNSSYFRFAFANKALETSLSVFNQQNTLQSDGDKIIYVKATSTATGYYGFRSANQPNLTISNFSIKAVSGNVGTMTNQDSADLVYSSVLPDQSFLTGVNSAYNFIDLDGSNEYIAHSNISFTGAFSISSWINLDNVSSGRPIVGDTGNNNWFKVVDADTAGIRIAGGTATEWDAGMTFPI
jgi:hypothetical protein